MPILEGASTRLRKHQWGYQGSNVSVIRTPATATRVIPLRGTPTVEPNLTFDDVDEGSLDPIQAPYYGPLDITESLSGRLTYNDLPWYLSAAIKSGVSSSGGGAAKTWVHQAASLTADPLGFITEEFGDGVTTDWYQFFGGVAEEFSVTGEATDPMEVSLNMRFAGYASTGSTDKPVTGTVPTAGLTVDDEPTRVFLADAEVFIDDAFGGIGTTKIADALQSLELTVSNSLDLKRPANGSNTRFQIAQYGRGEREITLTATWHKTTQTVGVGSESDDWMKNTPTKRFIEVRVTSPSIITGSTPYSWKVQLPAFYTTREEGEQDNNTTVILTARAVYDADLGYAFKSTTVNSLASPSTL